MDTGNHEELERLKFRQAMLPRLLETYSTQEAERRLLFSEEVDQKLTNLLRARVRDMQSFSGIVPGGREATEAEDNSTR